MAKVWKKLEQLYKNDFVRFVIVRQLLIVLVSGLVMLYNVYIGNIVLLFLTLVLNDTDYMYDWKQFLSLCVISFFFVINAIFVIYSF